MAPVISPAELSLLLSTKSVVLLDARTGPGAYEQYLAQHLTGAHYVALEHDLAAPAANPAVGGRHPLPAIEDFVALLGRLGIGPTTHVVVYDAKNGANAAARCWWMLRAVGHAAVQVLDGGLPAAMAAGLATDAGVAAAQVPTQPYPCQAWQLPTVSAAEVKQNLAAGGLVIDVREASRYRGETEPIDLIAGHIPGAVNVPFTTNLAADGLFLPAELLQPMYKDVIGNRDASDVILHCGSGVTACHTVLAMAQAGFDFPKLYVGSWSEWSRSGQHVATGVSA